MSKEQQFTAETARSLASSRKEIMAKNVQALADRIVEYVKTAYPAAVQKAIDENIYSESTKLHLPKDCRKAILKLSGNEYSLLKQNVDKRLSIDGFSMWISEHSWSCSECPWKYFTCTKYYMVFINWKR